MYVTDTQTPNQMDIVNVVIRCIQRKHTQKSTYSIANSECNGLVLLQFI